MYVGYSWPKVLQCPGPTGRYQAVFLDHSYLVAVSEHSIAVWSSGHARVRLGQHTLSAEEVEVYGRHAAACWSSDRGGVAVLTENGYLLLYDLHVTKHPALPQLRSQAWGPNTGHDASAALHTVDVYVKHPVRCDRDVPATCLCCDSRVILVAYADGYWGSCSWSGKMHPDLYDITPDDGLIAEDDDNNNNIQQPQQAQQQQQQYHHHPDHLARHAAVDVHYCEPSRLLSVVFADGSAALFSPAGATGHLQSQLVFRRWLCTAAAGATVARIAAQAQLIALGTAAGEVHLLQQHCPSAAAAAVGGGDVGMSPAAAAAAAAAAGMGHGGAARLGSKSAGALSPLGGACGQTPFDFGESGLDPKQLVRTLDLVDWGHTVKQTGAVAALAWAPDNRALAVGFSRQGLVVWMPSGCRLLCTLRQPAPETPASARASAAATPFTTSGSSSSTTAAAGGGGGGGGANGLAPGGSSSSSSSAHQQQHLAVVSVDASVLCLAWGVDGYQLLLAGQVQDQVSSSSHGAEAATAGGRRSSIGSGAVSGSVMYELSLAKSLRHHHRVTHAAAADWGAGGAGGGGGSGGPGQVAQLGDELHVLQASDRLLLITEALTSNGPSSFLAAGMGSNLDAPDGTGGSNSDLHVHHVLLPAPYLAANWPLQHVAVSPCGSDIAAAGVRGLVVYNRKQERWRMFGEVMQERRVTCVALGWLSGCVVAASCSSSSTEPASLSPAAAAAASAAVASAAATGLDLSRGAGVGIKCQLLLFPRNHLDFSSVVASTTLNKVPLAMDCTDSHILIASAPLELLVLQLQGGGGVLAGSSALGTTAASSAADGSGSGGGAAAGGGGRPPSAPGKGAKLVAVRELSLFNVGRPVQDVSLVSVAAAEMAHKALRGQSRGAGSSSSGHALLGAANAAGGMTGGPRSPPRYAVLLRWGGMLSVLDLSRGAELMLADEVETFWLSDTLPVPAATASSSRPGSTCPSAGHSRSSSIQGLPASAAGSVGAGAGGVVGVGGAAGQEGEAGDEGSCFAAVPGGLGVRGGSGSMSSSSMEPAASGVDSMQEVPEVVEMPWWAYGPVGMQLWFPSIVLAAMQLQTIHSSSSNNTLHSQASLPAQLSPNAAAAAAGLGPGALLSGLGSRTGSGVPGVLARSGSLWSPLGQQQQSLQSSGGSPAAAVMAAAAARAAAEAAAGRPQSSASAAAAAAATSPHLAHAQSAPALAAAQEGMMVGHPTAASAGGAGGFQTIQYGTEIELEFDREVYPIGVSLADASIVGITQRVMRSQQAAAPQAPASPRGSARSSSAALSRHHPLPSQGSLPSSAAASSASLSLPCFLPVPESQPVLPALLRRLLQQGALPEALALAKRHEGGPHFKRSLEWLLFTTLDMEGSKCKPGKTGGGGGASMQQQQQQSGLHVLQGGFTAAGAAAGVLGRQGKGWLGHVDGRPHPVPVTPLLAAAVDLTLSFQQCLDVVVSVSRKTDASLWPALFSAVGSPSAVLELLLDTGSLTSAACFLIVVDRLEGSHAAQTFAVQLIQLALKRGQFYLCAEILRFLIPPREGVVQWGPSSPVDGASSSAAAAAAGGVGTAASGGEAAQGSNGRKPLKQPSGSVAAAAADSAGGGWFSWIWGSSGNQSQPPSQQQQAADKAAAGGDAVAAACGADGSSLASQGSLPGPGQLQHGSDACRIVAEKAWRLLYQGKLGQLVQLIHSMCFLTGGLASIMAAFRPQQGFNSSLVHTASTAADLAAGKQLTQQQQQPAGGGGAAGAGEVAAASGAAAAAATAAGVQQDSSEDDVTVDVLIGCVLAAVEELPVWESTEMEQDAVLVLELVKELQVQRWTLAMAVVLVDMSVLVPFAVAQPALWQEFCGQLLEQPELYFLQGVVGALGSSGSDGCEEQGGVGELGERDEGGVVARGEEQQQLLQG